jgi:hypothetical protein
MKVVFICGLAVGEDMQELTHLLINLQRNYYWQQAYTNLIKETKAETHVGKKNPGRNILLRKVSVRNLRGE